MPFEPTSRQGRRYQANCQVDIPTPSTPILPSSRSEQRKGAPHPQETGRVY
jgi:hypothetical protein